MADTQLFVPGRTYRRRDLHAQYGGQRQGGISTPKRTNMIFLITGESGLQHGYADQWTDDGSFLYVGEGQYGDMKFVLGNRAIRDHVRDGKTLHLFEQLKEDKRNLRYLGEMVYSGHEFRQAPDTAGKVRQAIAFRLKPVGDAKVEAAMIEELPEQHRAGGRGAGFGSPENNKRVEQAAITTTHTWYEKQGWTVKSVERDKCGYDLRCTRGDLEEHVEVKGIQGDQPIFIITAGEVRCLMLDRRQVTCVVTNALAPSPRLLRYSRDEFLGLYDLEPLAFRAEPKAEQAGTGRVKAAKET